MLTLSLAFAADPGAHVTAAPGRGITVTADDDRFAMNLRARVQLRESLTVSAASDEGRTIAVQTQLYTARVWIGGHVFGPDVKYLLQLAVGPRDFRDGAISPVYDAYLDLTPHRDLSFRVGQMFVPFDRMRTVREFALQLPDRPRVVGELTLDRDIGITAYSDNLGGDDSPVAYKLGVFGGSGIHHLPARVPGALVVGRVELRPLGPIDDDSEGDLTRRPKPGLAIGLAGAVNVGTPKVRSTTSTVLPAPATYAHLAGDVVFKARGFAWSSEVVTRIASANVVEGVDDDGAVVTAPTRSGWGVVTQPSMMLGEKVEVAARYGRMGAFYGTDPALIADVAARANELGAGASLYLNGHRFKIQLGGSAFFGDEATLDATEMSAHALVDAMF